MPLLTLANVGHRYGTHVVLDGATFSVEPGEKVGLVGRNGCGKTTLMKVMTGGLVPDDGSVQLQRGARVGYLAQDPNLPPDGTVRDVAAQAFAELHALHQTQHDLYERMAATGPDELASLMRRQSAIEAKIEAAGGYAVDHRIDAMLHGLGFSDDQFTLRVEHLSGGQKGRLSLARLLLEAPDMLLLDEPTNHLDIDGRQWLETFLVDEYPGAVLIVSHDRWLLDRVVGRIVEVDRGGVLEYPGNYGKYVELRTERHLTRLRVHQKQVGKIRQEEQFIARYKGGQPREQARGRQSRLDRFKRDELVDRPLELEVARMSIPPAPRSGEQVVTAEGISKRYGDTTLFERFDFSMRRGDRVGLIGPNGVGKTTLVRCLLGDLAPDEGSVRLGTRLSVGYYRQLHEHLDLSLTVWQYLQSVIVGLDGQTRGGEQQARDLAGAFLFSGPDQEKPLADLSGGERSRAVLAGLVAGAHNLLVLDEPTNHLDIPSSERLEAVLSSAGGFAGSLLIVSHDRALLEATCDRLVIFEADGPVQEFPGRYSEWESRRADARSAAAAVAIEASEPAKRPAPAPRRQRDDDGPRDPLARLHLDEIEQRIEGIESRRREIDEAMLDPKVYTNGDRCRELKAEREALDRDLEPLELEWTRRAEDA